MARNSRAEVEAKSKTVVVEQVDEITLDKVKVQVRGQNLPLDEIVLDPMNPRVANTMAVSNHGSGQKMQNALCDLLWSDTDVQDLYRSVLANQGLIERVIVRSNMVVAEGNCRTVVYRKLRQNFPNDPTWRTIPARVLPADITDRQVAILLGELHVGGKNQWSPFEKAGHIHQLFTQFGMVQEEIAKILKTSKTAVNHNIRAFEAMKNKYLRVFPGPGAVRKFSYFLEVYKKPELREWITAVESADIILCFGDYFWFNFCQGIPEFSKLIEQKLSSGTPFFLEFVRAAESLKSRQLHSSVGQFLRRLGVIPTQNRIFSVLDAHLDHESGGSCWFRSEDGCLMNPEILGGVNKILLNSANELQHFENVFPVVQRRRIQLTHTDKLA